MYGDLCMDVKKSACGVGSLQLVVLKFKMKKERGDHQFPVRQWWRLSKSCVKISGSLWTISAFWFLRLPEAPYIGFWRKSCSIRRCVQDGSHKCLWKTTNSNTLTLPAKSSLSRQKWQLFGLDCHGCWNLGIPLHTWNQTTVMWMATFLFPQNCDISNKQSASKVMATVFWDQKGVLLIDFMASGTTIIADRCYRTLKKFRTRGMLNKGVSIFHNKARPYVAYQTHSTTTVWMEHHHLPTL